MSDKAIKDECEAVEKILKEPIFIGLDEKAIKTRNSLIGFSTFALFYTLGNLSIVSTKGYSFFGLSLSGVTDEKVKLFLLLTVSYFLIHFVWSSWDTFWEWKLRITGTNASFITTATMDMDEVDNINHPRQCTLSGWWLKQKKRFEAIENNPKLSPEKALESTFKALNDELSNKKRLQCSLERFEKRFFSFQKSQHIRWFIFEFLFPLLLGSSAVICLLTKIFC